MHFGFNHLWFVTIAFDSCIFLPIVSLSSGRHGLAKTWRQWFERVGHFPPEALEEFVQLLEVYGVACLLTSPRSPTAAPTHQFNKENFSETLKHYGVGYIHMPEIGAYATQNAFRRSRMEKQRLPRIRRLYASPRVRL